MNMPSQLNISELEALILRSIDQRYQIQATRNLADYIFSNHLFQSFPPEFLDFSFQYRREIAGYLADEQHLAALREYCIRSTKAYTYQRNQFINFTQFYDELLSAQYLDFLSQLRVALEQSDTIEALAKAYSTVLQRHHQRLRLILSSYCLTYQPGDLQENSLLKTVPCAEYSPQFQARLLGLDETEWLDPILDIGCGQSGKLVKYLSEKGYTAIGLDRLGPPLPNFIQQNWFEFDYGVGQWGTIIAHQSFSTHFIHAHLHHPGNAEEFAKLYMRILSALRRGGTFCYAPGLPFVEHHLEKVAGYSISKTVIEADQILGIGEVFYSVKVRSLSLVKESRVRLQ
ncbi:MAG TPA: class I SAM-dependent methyltransferase [Anaerolineae bacterium]|nr:class I SAM-dependent methyltransferase [Anaerolineae bacterium]HMR64169.1 class I SAM-dependent methyltransferase [Anaerolineae bacterium]